MLEGKELEGQIGDVGSYSLDVDNKGKVVVSATVQKDFGWGKASSHNSFETDIFAIAEQIAKKTATTLDDNAITTLKTILGLL